MKTSIRLLITFLAALVLSLGCKGGTTEHQKLGAAPTGYYNASWETPAWYVDPSNSSGVASDTNTCTSSGAPCKTWGQIVERWGTVSPRLKTSVTITFLSSHSDKSDPVTFKPQIENSAYVNILCSLPAAAQTGTLAGVVAKANTQGAPQLLNATLGAGAAVGQLIVNTTHPSRAWVYKNVAGNTWAITQPLAPVTLPATSSSTEVNTWANGDAFSVYSPTKVLFAELHAVTSYVDNATYANELQVNGCAFFDPSGAGLTNTRVGGDVFISESSMVSGGLLFDSTPSAAGAGAANGFMSSIVSSATGYFLFGYQYSQTRFSGGWIGYINAPTASFLNGIIIDYPHSFGLYAGVLSDVYLGTGAVLSALGPVQLYGPVWGPGTMDAKGGTFFYPSGAGAAAANIRVAVTNLQGQNKACLAVPGAASAFATCNLALTAAQLDTSLGATAGCLTTGAAAFCNYGP